ncbi:MAG: hypothetical protein IKQ88_00920 [Lachnospiraceae bacterium]|nr:hypothetical protein [Lachnospiraceae bacterium]
MFIQRITGKKLSLNLCIIIGILVFYMICMCFRDYFSGTVSIVLLFALNILRIVFMICVVKLIVDAIKKVNELDNRKIAVLATALVYTVCTALFIGIWGIFHNFWNFRQDFGRQILRTSIPVFLTWIVLCIIVALRVTKMLNGKPRRVGIWLGVPFIFAIIFMVYLLTMNSILHFVYYLEASEDYQNAHSLIDSIYKTWEEKPESYWVENGDERVMTEEGCSFFDIDDTEFLKSVFSNSAYENEADFWKHINDKNLMINVHYNYKRNGFAAVASLPDWDRVNRTSENILLSVFTCGLWNGYD